MTAIDNFTSTHSSSGLFADLILDNGRIRTMNPAQPWAESVAIRGGRLIAVGLRGDVLPFKGPLTRVHDLQGAFCMPGLHDMHTHPDLALAPRYSDDLDVGIEDPTPEQLKQAILAYAESHPGDGWIHGQYWVRYTFRGSGWTPSRSRGGHDRSQPVPTARRCVPFR